MLIKAKSLDQQFFSIIKMYIAQKWHLDDIAMIITFLTLFFFEPQCWLFNGYIVMFLSHLDVLAIIKNMLSK